jgi:hypothetical protein
MHGARQESMATPGNFGGKAQARTSFFLGITRAPPSAPGRERAQSPLCGETRTPRPQSTRQHESGSQLEGFLFSKAIGHYAGLDSNFQREDVGAVSGSGWVYRASRRYWNSRPREVSQTGHNEVSNQGPNGTGSMAHQILHDRHADNIYFLDAKEAKWSKRH